MTGAQTASAAPLFGRRCNDGFGTGPRPQLRSVKKELDLDSIEREDDPPILDAVKNPGVQ